MPQRDEQQHEQTLHRIARDTLNVATLETRGRDQLDFHDLSVWQLRQALEQAYDASDDGMTASERAMTESANDGKAATPDAKSRKKREGLSCLDAAAKVLAEAGEPMNTKAMVEAMMAKGYWTTDAPTPAATLYSALLREMQKKGDDARFTKVERGLFDLTNTAKGA